MNQIYHTKVINNPLESWYAKIAQKPCFLRLRALEPRAGATSRKVLGPGKMFPLPSSTTNGHPIFRGPVRRASASVTRFFVMLHSSPSPRGRRAIIARNLSPVGVRLSGGNRAFLDVTQTKPCPSRDDDRGKNTQKTLPTFWPASRAIWPR